MPRLVIVLTRRARCLRIPRPAGNDLLLNWDRVSTIELVEPWKVHVMEDTQSDGPIQHEIKFPTMRSAFAFMNRHGGARR